MSLDKRLKDLCENYVDDKVDFSGYVEAIKQAFIEEGWVSPRALGNMNEWKLVTGAEWLTRFEKELEAMPCDTRYVWGDTTVETHSMSQVEKAARRAAGVDHE